MAITLISGPANAGKAQVVLDSFCAHAAREQEPILVVPTRSDLERYRRELAEDRLVLAVRVEQFEGLIEEIAKRTSSTVSTIGTLTREHILTRLYSENPPESQAQPASAGTIRALGALIAELETEQITPTRLSGALLAWEVKDSGGAQSSRWIGRLFEDYQKTLTGLDRADKQLRATWALDQLRRAPSRWKGTPVLFYGFDDLSTLQLDAIETLGRIVDAPVTVSLTYEPGRAAFSGRAHAINRLQPLSSKHHALPARADYYESSSRAALHHLERSLFEEGPERIDPGQAVRLLQAGGQRAEIELIAGEIRALIQAGTEPAQIAVVHREPQTIAALLSEVFGAYEVPFSLERETRFEDTPIGAGLIGLLRCALLDGSAQDLLTWLRTPGLLDRPELADRLERSLRQTGTRSARLARARWEKEHWKLEAIDAISSAAQNGPAALIARIERELQWLFIAARRRQAALLDQDEIEDARALTAASGALAELRELAGRGSRLAPSGAELIATLKSLRITSEDSSALERVAVLGPLELRARRVGVMFLCGLQEGVFPKPGRSEALLASEQRRTLAEASGLLLVSQIDPLDAERYLLYACLSRPECQLVLSWHTSSDDGSPSSPSLFIEEVRDLFDESLSQNTRTRSLGAASWPGPGPPSQAMSARELILDKPSTLAPTIPALTDQRLLEELRTHTVWSASALESYASCPVRWFVERLLKAKDLDPDPEPLSRGTLAHAVLKDTFTALKLESGSARLRPTTLELARKLLADILAEHAQSHQLSSSPERAAAVLRRLQADLERYLERAAEIDSPFEPEHFELAFGSPEEQDGLDVLHIGEGVRIRGQIDRIDIDGQGRAIVYDYKGKSVLGASKWLAENNFQLALYMRAAERLLNLDPVGGFYQPLAGKDPSARGILNDSSQLELGSVRTDRLAPEDFHECLEQTLLAAHRAASEAASGALTPRPESCGYDGNCSYPSICRCER